MSELLKAAIQGLGINVPIYRTELQDEVPGSEGGVLTLYLYGGRVVRWPPSTLATPKHSGSKPPVTTSPILATTGDDRLPDLVTTSPEMEPTGAGAFEGPVTIPPASPTDDLTTIPQVGDATAKALADAGYLTFPDIISAPDTDLLTVTGINTYTLPKIRAYLRARWA